MSQSPVKLLVASMVAIALVLVALLGGYLWLLFGDADRAVWWVVLVLGALVLWTVPLACAGVACLLWAIYGRPPRVCIQVADRALRFLFPMVQAAAQWLGVERERASGAFVEIHNRLLKMNRDLGQMVKSPAEVLVLLPHCMQRSECPYKITWDVTNCRRCGCCTVGDVMNIVDEMGLKVAVAAGGTQARQILQRLSPRAIVAVACERELEEGIRDVPLIPVLAVVNERPEGPCINTCIDPGELRAALGTLNVKGEA